MAVIGIVCEYNPFHRGHQLHIEKTRAALGENSPVVCVMSGDFVQRGEAAVYAKSARAEAACRCGADLVAELPLPWSLASAEGFARGAVSLLGALGASHLAFGSETGELRPLEDLAQTLLDPALTAEVKALLTEDASLSYAAARERAAARRLGERALLLRQPNNILAVEYLKAAYDQRLELEPLPILREGAGHDAERVGDGPCSAAQLRQRLRAGKSLEGEIPPEAAAVFSRERERGREIADSAALELAVLSRLRMLEEEDYLRLPDAGDGPGRRLYRAVQEERSLDAVLSAAKTKRYALSRLRRMCLCAALGVREGMSRELPPYARILALNARGRELLRGVRNVSPIPILTKPAAVRDLGRECETLFTLGARAHDLYVLGYPAEGERRAGMDWRTGPVIVEGCRA